jgi:hypothetical protein
MQFIIKATRKESFDIAYRITCSGFCAIDGASWISAA